MVFEVAVLHAEILMNLYLIAFWKCQLMLRDTNHDYIELKVYET